MNGPPDKEARPGDGDAHGRAEAPATGLGDILSPGGRITFCPSWAVPGIVAADAAAAVASGRPVGAADLDVIVYSDCVDDS